MKHFISKKMRFILILPLFFMYIAGVSAQGMVVQGTVVDESNAGLPGVTVMVKGTTTGTATDTNGNFYLTVPDGSGTLVVSYVGYQMLEIPINNRAAINVTLAPDSKVLDEVVVIGYGTTTRRELTGSVATVKSEEITLAPTHNALEAIQGRAPGVDVTRSSGQAGSGVNITVRGNRSISGNNNPLYIIDGFQGGSIDNLNTNDIESIEVLKDASATAIYGSQGANGVIIVTTKKGAEGKTRVSYNGYYGVNGLTPFPDVRLGDDYIQLRREAWRTTGHWSSPDDDPQLFANEGEWEAIQEGRWIDWQDLLMRDGTIQNHSVSVSGGSEKTKAFFSGGYFKEEGLLRNDDMTRYNGRFNLEHKINTWAKAGMLGQLTYTDINRRTSNLLSNAMTASPFGVPFDEDGNINLYPNPADQNFPSVLTDERGPHIAKDNTIRTNIMFNAFVELSPIKGLSFRSNFGTNLTNYRRGQFDHATSWRQRNNNITEATATQGYNRFYNWDNILSYSRDFGDHSFTVTGVTNYIQSDNDELRATGINQPLSSQLFYNLNATDPASRNIHTGYVGHNMMSYAGRLNYDYKGRYFLTMTNRLDGASRLAPGNKWASFPSVAAAWIISDEAFMGNMHAVSFLKIRASYGLAGNSAIDPYGTQSVVYADNRMAFGEVPAPTYLFLSRVGNPTLGWENSATTNLGLDLAFFNGKISANVDVYNTETTDILLERNLPQLTGVGSVYQNIGSTNNRGIELLLTSQNIRARNFTWSTTATFTSNRERITGLIDNNDIIVDVPGYSRLIGHPINSYFAYKKLGIWQLEEEEVAQTYTFGGQKFAPGDIKVHDLNGDNLITPDDRMYVGSQVPKWVAGLQNNFRYRSFDLGVYVFARWGQTIFAEVLGRYNESGERNGPAAFDYWTPENPTNDYPRPRRNIVNAYPGGGLLNIVDGSFFKIKNLTLGYTVPKAITQKIMTQNIRIYATGSNIWTISKSHLLREYDPERGGAESYPLNRQIVCGFNIDF